MKLRGNSYRNPSPYSKLVCSGKIPTGKSFSGDSDPVKLHMPRTLFEKALYALATYSGPVVNLYDAVEDIEMVVTFRITSAVPGDVAYCYSRIAVNVEVIDRTIGVPVSLEYIAPASVADACFPNPVTDAKPMSAGERLTARRRFLRELPLELLMYVGEFLSLGHRELEKALHKDTQIALKTLYAAMSAQEECNESI